MLAGGAILAICWQRIQRHYRHRNAFMPHPRMDDVLLAELFTRAESLPLEQRLQLGHKVLGESFKIRATIVANSRGCSIVAIEQDGLDAVATMKGDKSIG